ncbi:MAG: YraN family protein [Magnetovibrio sp.]|nr:YraN family protein [Magnetovibrio sp.]
MNEGRAETGGRAWAAGRRAETWTAWWLRLKGYRIVARRFQSPVGEIDLVARKGRTLVFCEVKVRADADTAAESITHHQRRRIERAALAFLQRHPGLAGLDLRFDAIVFGRAGGPRPRHMADAWRPDS